MTARRKQTAELDTSDQREANRAAPADTTTPQEREVPIRGREQFGRWGEEVGRFVAGTVSSVRRIGETGTRQRPGTNAAAGEPAGERTTRQRAEVLVDDFGDWTKQVGSMVTRQVMRLASRVREEGEDIWAEARAVQHRDREPSARPTEPEQHAPME
jgi:hypothetical protein